MCHLLHFKPTLLNSASCSTVSTTQCETRNHLRAWRQGRPGPRLTAAVPIWDTLAPEQKPPTIQVSISCGAQALNGQVFLIKGCQFWLALHKHSAGVRKDDFARWMSMALMTGPAGFEADEQNAYRNFLLEDPFPPGTRLTSPGTQLLLTQSFFLPSPILPLPLPSPTPSPSLSLSVLVD